MMDVRRMLILRAVVTSGSVSAAAANLGYTPSAVSQQVTTLEKEAGIALLERVGRGVRPTAAGLLLTEHADIISRNVADAETAMADLRSGRTGALTVRYFATVGAPLVAPALVRFRREHPLVRLDLTLTEPEDPVLEVEQGRADLALVVGAGDGHRPGVRLVHLLDDPFHAVLPAGHRLATDDAVTLADLAGEPWVGGEPPGPCLEPVHASCAAAGFSPNYVVECDDYATAQGFVAAGLGVGLMPDLALGTRHPGVTVHRIRRPEPVRSIYAAVRETELGQAALRTLLEALQEAATR